MAGLDTLLSLGLSFWAGFVLWLWTCYRFHLMMHQAVSMRDRLNVTLAKDSSILGLLLPGWPYIRRGPKILLDNYVPGIPLAIKTRETYYIHFSSHVHMTELRDAPEEQLSLHAVSKDVFRPEYTMNGLEIDEDMKANGSAHLRAFRVILPSQLQYLGTTVSEILAKSFQDEFQKITTKQCRKEGEWTRIETFEMAKTVLTAASAYVFFGADLGTDPSFVQAALEYPEDVFFTSEVLGFVPSFLQPLVAPKLMRNHKASNLLVSRLLPVIERRLRQPRAGTQDSTCSGTEQQQQKLAGSRDCIQFLIDSSSRDREAWTAKRIVQVLLGTWLAAVHQPAIAAVYALENICRHSDFIALLRREIDASSLPNGAHDNQEKPLCDSLKSNTAGMHELELSPDPCSSSLASDIDRAPLLDAFLKESSRLHPSDSISTRRKVLTPFTFKDGTHILSGDVACVPLQAIMQDEQYYPSSQVFNPYRFITTDGAHHKETGNVDESKDVANQRPKEPNKKGRQENTSRFTDADLTYPLWGLGKHSCPARFYASVLLKLFIAHILTHYDLKLPDNDEKNCTGNSRTFFYRSAIMPKPGSYLLFRRRVG